MSQRIEAKFSALKSAGKKGLVTFIMAGDPDIATSSQILASLPQAGADIIEIGMPFSDPMADGPVIQAAGQRALKAHTRLRDVLMMSKQFRANDQSTPIIVMGYYNPVYRYGVERFCHDAVEAGIDGVILVDLPPEEEHEFIRVADPVDLKLIRLVAPTTTDQRLEMLCKHAGGFLYYISVAGVTGTKSADISQLTQRTAHIASHASLPLAVGFGVRTPEQAAKTAETCDAVVVGSALVEILAQHGVKAGLEFVRALRDAIHKN